MPDAATVSIREWIEVQISLRWRAHEAEHQAMSAAMIVAERNLIDMTKLRWQSHGDQHHALDTARESAQNAINVRLESMNEYRQQLALQAATFLTRDSAAEK